MQKQKIYTVSELNNQVKDLLEGSFPAVWVEGEISNFRRYPSGHLYFSLKDEQSQVSVVMFRAAAELLKFNIAEGLKVVVLGRVTCFTKRGDYQIVINFLEPQGKGALQLAFEQLKEKLAQEGLFDLSRKKTIPLLPQKIGIVTSSRGAAIRDILSVLNRRFANVEILLYSVRVQGEGAKEEIAQALDDLNREFSDLDVILLGRGGGSVEDLWAFNEEIVARAIARSRIPIISCVGHEIDFTIADFVADLRAPTPSAAAELVVKNKEELMQRLENLKNRLTGNMGYLLNSLNEKLTGLKKTPFLIRPTDFLEEKFQEIDNLSQRITMAMNNSLNLFSKNLEIVLGKLNALSPLAIFQRGYALVWKMPEQKVVKSWEEVNLTDRLRVRLFRGELLCAVEKRGEKLDD
ncbi:MAG: exodeoxyribonuclease VII large subunit [Elusimicrobiota bacterium]